jgi:hypothetical protein
MCTGRSVAMKKPVLAIYRPQEGKILSAMIRGGYQTHAYVHQERQFSKLDGIHMEKILAKILVFLITKCV